MELVMLQLTDTQQVAVAVSALDKKGQPTAVQGIVFASSDMAIVTVAPDAADPAKATIVAGLPGIAQVTVTADADLGEGVQAITGALDITVVAGAAASLSVTPGAPTEQP
jgi:hypothetical protein